MVVEGGVREERGGGGERGVDGGNWDFGVDGLVVFGGCDGDDVLWYFNFILSFEFCEFGYVWRFMYIKCLIKCLREWVL